MLETLVRQVLASNLARLGRDTAYYNFIFRGLPQSFYANHGVVPQIGHDCFVPNLLVGNLLEVLGFIQALLGETEESGDKFHHQG
jgi:hypothetical protein